MVQINREKYYPFLISGLAVFTAQILQGILFYAIYAGLQKMQISASGIFWVILPGFLAVLGGGAFQGRLLPAQPGWFYSGTGCVNAILPAAFQVMFAADRFGWLTDLNTMLTMISSVLIWIAGSWLGQISLDKNPAPAFDRMLRNITAGAALVLIALYGFVWVSIRFSESYKIAAEIPIPMPPGIEEIKSDFMTPDILTGKRFDTIIEPEDTSIYAFYEDEFSYRGYENITTRFQEWTPGDWQYRKEESGDQVFEYQITGSHWLEPRGKVMVSLLLQAEKQDDVSPWNETFWKVSGMVATRTYFEPQNPGTGSPVTPSDSGHEVPEISSPAPATAAEISGESL